MADPCATPVPDACLPTTTTDARVLDNFRRRYNTARKQATDPPAHPNNGDINLPDRSGSYSKGIQQDSPGKVNLKAFDTFLTATAGGHFQQFEDVPLGNMGNPDGRLNGPMGAYAYCFMGAESSEFATDPPPRVSSRAYATELVEMYWCSLLRDVAFSEYAGNATAQDAAKELSTLPEYAGPTNGGTVTPELLFRGNFPGERIGPYLSQFLVTKTNFGAAPFDQRYITYKPHVDYMTDESSWFAVQQGVAPQASNQPEKEPRFLHNGRGMAAFTHVDELYQSYLTAYLAMKTLGVPPNPGVPYIGAMKQKPFGTFGGPDIAAVLAQVAKYAVNAVWYQKWVVHLRHRPEAGGGLVHWIAAHNKQFDAVPDPLVFGSKALAKSYEKHGTYLLSQPFPEGSPTHPAYPTGHGTVGGACITLLKFFFDGKHELSDPVMPNHGGTGVERWTGQPGTGASGTLKVNGELNKLAHNITFAHGLHGGIHWRSDSDASVLLGEAAALSFLQDLACTYAEKFSINLERLDGTMATISNM